MVMVGAHIQRLWVRIPAPCTGWTFFTFIWCKTLFEKTKINEKEAGIAPFSKQNCDLFHVVSVKDEN